jgi:hypothetical protein
MLKPYVWRTPSRSRSTTYQDGLSGPSGSRAYGRRAMPPPGSASWCECRTMRAMKRSASTAFDFPAAFAPKIAATGTASQAAPSGRSAS